MHSVRGQAFRGRSRDGLVTAGESCESRMHHGFRSSWEVETETEEEFFKCRACINGIGDCRSLCLCQRPPQLAGIGSIKNVCKWFDERVCVPSFDQLCRKSTGKSASFAEEEEGGCLIEDLKRVRSNSWSRSPDAGSAGCPRGAPAAAWVLRRAPPADWGINQYNSFPPLEGRGDQSVCCLLKIQRFIIDASSESCILLLLSCASIHFTRSLTSWLLSLYFTARIGKLPLPGALSSRYSVG
jgi:hypothetical protein